MIRRIFRALSLEKKAAEPVAGAAVPLKLSECREIILRLSAINVDSRLVARVLSTGADAARVITAEAEHLARMGVPPDVISRLIVTGIRRGEYLGAAPSEPHG